jgi:hypothetical protein
MLGAGKITYLDSRDLAMLGRLNLTELIVPDQVFSERSCKKLTKRVAAACVALHAGLRRDAESQC